MSKPKILFYDIETAPLMGYAWGLWDQNIGLNQIHTDWHVLSWAAKWLGSKEVLYKDQRAKSDVTNDKQLLKGMWDLLDEADIVVTQNGKEFDQKKLNARFVYHGFQPPSPYKHIDTLKLARKHFAFTSNKLAYLTDKLCKKYKKTASRKFQGFDLWKECLGGNISAWKEMEKYNKYDVLSLEELYSKLIPWDSSVNFNLYRTDDVTRCTCGSTHFQKRGFYYTASGKFQKHRCMKCGAETYSGKNLLAKGSIRKGVTR